MAKFTVIHKKLANKEERISELEFGWLADRRACYPPFGSNRRQSEYHNDDVDAVLLERQAGLRVGAVVYEWVTPRIAGRVFLCAQRECFELVSLFV